MSPETCFRTHGKRAALNSALGFTFYQPQRSFALGEISRSPRSQLDQWPDPGQLLLVSERVGNRIDARMTQAILRCVAGVRPLCAPKLRTTAPPLPYLRLPAPHSGRFCGCTASALRILARAAIAYLSYNLLRRLHEKMNGESQCARASFGIQPSRSLLPPYCSPPVFQASAGHASNVSSHADARAGTNGPIALST